MKLLRRVMDNGYEGAVTLIPDKPEDMWHAYNLIAEGDCVQCSTIRKVQTESFIRSSKSYRVRTMLTISVENMDFDSQACMLRLKGRNIEENEYVAIGAYHTLSLELNRTFSLWKHEWDSVSWERIKIACRRTQSADVAAVIMQKGLAHVCLITSSMTIVRAKINVNIPRKRKGCVKQHEQELSKFYDQVMQAILRHIDFEIVKCVLLASPGFVRDQFYEFMFEMAVKTDNQVLLKNKLKFMLIHSSSGFKHSLKEVLQDPAVISKISDTKAASEVKALENFYTTLQCDPAKAFYGKKHVEMANEAKAIEVLLISDKLFRCADVKLRKEYVQLVNSVRKLGGDVKIFSSMHISGEQLEQVTGIAAILRFPMPELEDTDDEEDE